jgi:uncharacterized membrane protein YoaK (UPF0700 family)
LVILTVVTGIVDAVSYLALGHVFVANMTGNVVFLGFGLAGSRDVGVFASIVAIVAFAIGASGGGLLGARYGAHRGRLLTVAVAIKFICLVAAVGIAVLVHPVGDVPHYVLITVLALAMGIQNAVTRRIAVPDLTTTVLTLTITGLAADIAAGGRKPGTMRRVLSVLSMLVGAVIGGILTLHASVAIALGCACVLFAVAGLAIWRASRNITGGWSTAR